MKVQYIEVKILKKSFMKEMTLFDDLDILKINVSNSMTQLVWITQNLLLPLNLKFLHIRIRIDIPLPDELRVRLYNLKVPFGCVLYVETDLYLYSAENAVKYKNCDEDIIRLKPDFKDCLANIKYMNRWYISNVEDMNTLKERHKFFNNLIN